MVTTTLRVVDKHNKAVTGITPEQLKVEVGGKPAKVTSVTPASKPRFLIMLDVSHSMVDKWKPTIEIARKMSNAGGDDVDIVAFGPKILGYGLGAQDTDKYLSELARTEPHDRATAIYNSLVEIGSRVNRRDVVIILISDGGDDVSHYSADQTAEMFRRSSWPPIYALILESGESMNHTKYMQHLTSGTGGLMVLVRPGEIDQSARDLSSLLLAPTSVTLQPDTSVADPKTVKFEIVDATGKPRRDLQPIYTETLQGCSSPTK